MQAQKHKIPLLITYFNIFLSLNFGKPCRRFDFIILQVKLTTRHANE